ncbi:MAG: ABC transporter ATP-binding protein [Thermomicrobiales bacterium]|nr:ABC transporter ATP-binding protein [Thermomicrobiales bacterium]
MSTAIAQPNHAPAGIGKRGDGTTPVLELQGLTKKFGDFTAVNHLSLSVKQGEVVGFLGPNGAGKSTTVGMVLGLIRPTAGSVTIMGTPLVGNQPMVAEHIGAIIENPAFYPYLSGRDNLIAHAKMVDGVTTQRVDDLLKLVNLHERKQDKYKSYSLGMKQRLGIASTLLTDPALVILDEPTNGLDPAGQREIREIIPQLAREGHGVLLASHMLHEVEQVSDRVAIVRRGELVTESSVDDLLMRGGYIEVRVEQADEAKALQLVRSLNDVENVTASQGLITVVTSPDRGREINRTLVEAGIFAAEIAPKRNTLESLFLELTEGETV